MNSVNPGSAYLMLLVPVAIGLGLMGLLWLIRSMNSSGQRPTNQSDGGGSTYVPSDTGSTSSHTHGGSHPHNAGGHHGHHSSHGDYNHHNDHGVSFGHSDSSGGGFDSGGGDSGGGGGDGGGD